MTDSVALCEGMCDIAGRGMSVRMDTLGTDYGIERFKCLCREENGWSKTADMGGKVYHNVKFRLVEPTVRPSGST